MVVGLVSFNFGVIGIWIVKIFIYYFYIDFLVDIYGILLLVVVFCLVFYFGYGKVLVFLLLYNFIFKRIVLFGIFVCIFLFIGDVYMCYNNL